MRTSLAVSEADAMGQITPVAFELRYVDQTVADQKAALPRVHQTGSGPGEVRGSMDKGSKLREALEGPDITIVALVQDALTARLAEAAGVAAVVLASSSVSSALLGMPDAGLVTLSEMEFVLARAADACEIPILVDGEAGFGNAINAGHAVRVLERAGAAGILLEDQDNPPRVTGGTCISSDEMVGKVEIAVNVRANDSFVVIARSDAREREGIDAVIERGQRYVAAGADGFFAYGQLSELEMRRVVEEVPARFHICIQRGARRQDLQAMGFDGVMPPSVALRAGAFETFQRYRELSQGPEATPQLGEVRLPSPELWSTLTRTAWVHDLEQRYLPPDVLARFHG
jgi:2-methylisocitrate lyase-like PEP mutase family enzyme